MNEHSNVSVAPPGWPAFGHAESNKSERRPCRAGDEARMSLKSLLPGQGGWARVLVWSDWLSRHQNGRAGM